ncbi:MAG: hypothetical protein U1E73_06395 [Planctomycetota bacterium]
MDPVRAGAEAAAEVAEHDGAARAAVRGPQLQTIRAVAAGEQHDRRARYRCERTGDDAVALARHQVGDEQRSCRSFVGGPQLASVLTVVGDEEQPPRRSDEVVEGRR